MIPLSVIIAQINGMFHGIERRAQFYGNRPDDVVSAVLSLERFLIPHLIIQQGEPSPYWAIAYSAFVGEYQSWNQVEQRFADSDWTQFRSQWQRFMKWREPRVAQVMEQFANT